MRPLELHVSALSDSEYNLYTASLNDLSVTVDTAPSAVCDDAHYERMSVGVREARAWLRGRYSDLAASDIDAILKLFCPNMLPSDSLTDGQFFAALRLVVHAESGKGIDRTLAFVQAHPTTTKVNHVPRPSSPPKRSVQAPPSHPDRPKPSTSNTSSQESNPFTRRSVEKPAAQPRVDLELPPVIPQRHSQKISHNPFLMHDKADRGELAEKSSDKVAGAPCVAKNGKLPPLPPRKPALLVAPRPSEAVPSMITSTANLMSPFGSPLIATKPTHMTSPLMRQSLEASKQGQTMKRAEEQLDRERVLQVLKTTSSGSSGSSRTRSLSPSKHISKLPNDSGSEGATFVPPLPRRRKPSSPSSASSSLPSLDQVASATLKSVSSPLTTAPFRPPLPSRDSLISTNSPSMTNTDYLPSVPGPGPNPVPPMHPDRRPSIDDSQTPSPSSPRVMRSKSMHHPGAPQLPPPPRRKRPESVQLTPTSNTTELPNLPSRTSSRSHSRMSSFQGLSRHLSLTRDKDNAETSPMSNIQKTISNLQLKAQPKLEAARYKAEAGISRRGYVNHAQLGGTWWREDGEERLMPDTRWAATNIDPYSEPTTDDEPNSGDDQGKRQTSGVSHRDSLTEVDNLKWPAGEGWKPL
ncbi:hypothetical protein PAXINDRAFT_118627 [Paxillus involutus ATCC 200175]|uniref:Unplaced genomic scaffold PAXINscaffold_50, whole genome shotgun sequence n=1 Tax=Paxillus involutus ATCC 200175 TaxID=664439 RepID=A0A0C9ST49_PAXIN|nr:hypothetical protein PAXINDRAFT_118627 [Paxillus involutus ATCC 200175]